MMDIFALLVSKSAFTTVLIMNNSMYIVRSPRAMGANPHAYVQSE